MTANATEKSNSVIVETGFIGNLKRDILLSAADDVAHFCPVRRDFGAGKRRQATFLRLLSGVLAVSSRFHSVR